MSRRASKLFDQGATLFSAQAERLIHRTLSNKEESVLSKPSTVKEFVQVAESDAFAIEQILLPTTAIGATCDLNLREGEIEESIVIRNAERNLSKAELPPLLGAGEDHLINTLRANATTRLAERPAQRVNDV
jgi:ribose 1,5-bisphosphokinase PhnN